MLCFIEPDNINKVYKKILKKYNKKEFDVFYNYFNRTWKNKSKKKILNLYLNLIILKF